MLTKTINYLKRSLDYPVDICADYRDGLHYYLDLTHYFDQHPFSHIVFDNYGIIQYDYAVVPPPNNKLGRQYNHTYIALWALANLHLYLLKKDEKNKEEFIKHARWLKANCSQRQGKIVWQTMFDWTQYDFKMKVPLVTSMDHGLAISVMTRAYKITQDKSYLDLAKKAVSFYGAPLKEGGFCAEFKKGELYYEMYPVEPLSFVLDGSAFSLGGLYDVYLADGDKQAKYFFDIGAETLLRNIDFWDFKGYWSWFGRFYLSPPWYHKLNYCWMSILADIKNAKDVMDKIKGWDPKKHDFITKAKVKTYFFLTSRDCLYKN